jgi:GNAT superfamily N-acetyltransferase
MKLVPDKWLGGIFGYDVFKLMVEEHELINLSEIFSEDRLPLRAFYYVKIPVTSIDRVGALTEAGFRVMDVNVTFEREPADLPLNNATLVRNATREDESDLLDIAGSTFVYSRFHLDPFIEKSLADRVKREWMASYLRGQRGDRILVAEIDGKPVGFLALLLTGGSEKTGIIDLIGVTREMQGRGVGRSLVESHIRDAYGRYSRLLVGTQIANVPSMRLYGRCGYRISGSAYVLHAHVREGRII